jgi:hypothetical protein
MSNSPPQATIASNPLELCVRSLAVLVKQRAEERDVALSERDQTRRERDTAKQMLCVTLGLLHEAEKRNRRLVCQVRSRFGLDIDQTHQLQDANDAFDWNDEGSSTGQAA